MYEQFYGLDYDPFRLTPTGRDVFAHTSFERARSYLEYGLLRAEGFVVITGPPGSGKTTLIRELLHNAPSGTRYAQIETSRLGADDLLRLVVARFGINPGQNDKASTIEALRDNLYRHARAGNRALLIVDEAQDLPVESLEELRLLTNLVHQDKPLLQIVLLGQPGLRDLIRRPELEQFHQRTVASCRLKPLEEAESIEFVRFRLQCAGWHGDPAITMAALRLLHAAAEGVPRRLNLLASRLLLHGFAEGQHRLGIDDAAEVLDEMEDEAVGDWRQVIDALRRGDEGQAITPETEPPTPSATPADTVTHNEPKVETAQPEADPQPAPEQPHRTSAEQTPNAVNPGADVIVPEAAQPPSYRRPPAPPAKGRQQHKRSSPVSALVVVSVGVALVAVVMVILAATPAAEAIGVELGAWFRDISTRVLGNNG